MQGITMNNFHFLNYNYLSHIPGIVSFNLHVTDIKFSKGFYWISSYMIEIRETYSPKPQPNGMLRLKAHQQLYRNLFYFLTPRLLQFQLFYTTECITRITTLIHLYHHLQVHYMLCIFCPRCFTCTKYFNSIFKIPG